MQGTVKTILALVKDYFETNEVRYIKGEHDAWLAADGFGNDGMFQFVVEIFAIAQQDEIFAIAQQDEIFATAQQDLLHVELRLLSGSRTREMFAQFANRLAKELRVVFKHKPGLPAPPQMKGILNPEALLYTAKYIAELLGAPDRLSQLRGLTTVAALDNQHAEIFKVGQCDAEVEEVTTGIVLTVAKFASEGIRIFASEGIRIFASEGIRMANEEFEAMAFRALASLLEIQWCNPAVLEPAASAAVLGVYSHFHGRREALRCCVALTKRPEAMPILRGEISNQTNFMECIDDIIKGGQDKKASELAELFRGNI